MADGRIERVLDAAYVCFTRHGARRTTMDDIASEAGMSRPAVYQYVRNKDDAFRRLAQRLFDRALARARQAADAPDRPLPERLAGILAAKLELTVQLWRDSPHAAELIGANARLSADLDAAFMASMRELVASALTRAAERGQVTLGGADADEVAELALALTRGLEADLTDPDIPHRRLRQGIALLVAGLAVPGRHHHPDPEDLTT